MQNEFIKYEQALALKELGFDEPCLGMFDEYKEFNCLGIPHNANILQGCISRPLYQQAFRWFREKYQLFQEIQIDQTSSPKFCFKIIKFVGNPINLSEKEWYWEEIKVVDWFLYRTYEEAESVCLDKLIEICKNK